jgi:hypothetical protein
VISSTDGSYVWILVEDSGTQRVTPPYLTHPRHFLPVAKQSRRSQPSGNRRRHRHSSGEEVKDIAKQYDNPTPFVSVFTCLTIIANVGLARLRGKANHRSLSVPPRLFGTRASKLTRRLSPTAVAPIPLISDSRLGAGTSTRLVTLRSTVTHHHGTSGIRPQTPQNSTLCCSAWLASTEVEAL